MRYSTLLVGVAFAVTCAARAGAQTGAWTEGEVRLVTGAWVPTGAMRDDFGTATLVGVQGAARLGGQLRALLAVSWTHAHARRLPADDVTHVWQWDMGVERAFGRARADGWTVLPFAGLGAGLRSYDHRASGDLRSCTAAYGALGGELRRGTLALRAEARDYVSCYESPATGSRQTRNDVGVTVGVGYRLW